MSCSAALLAAQGTYIVDIANPPGTDYTQIAVAALAVPSGSVLLVRAGVYQPVVIHAKSLTVLCDANVFAGEPTLGPFLRIQYIQAAQRVHVRGLRQNPASPGTVTVTSAAGPVVLDGNGSTLQVPGTCMIVSGSNQLAVRNYSMFGRPPLTVYWSKVVVENCTLTGLDQPYAPASGLDISGGEMQTVHSSIRGGHGYSIYVKGTGVIDVPPGPAVSMFASSLRVLGTAANSVLEGTGPNGSGAIQGSGVVRVDAPVVLGPVPPSTGPPVTRPWMPSVTTIDAPPGGTIVVRRYGPTGVPFAIGVSLPAPAFAWPGAMDPLWLDPGAMYVEAIGTVSVAGPFAVQKPVPNAVTLRGLAMHWQSAELDAAGALVFSNPSCCLIH
ncbi:MAG: hypothetical protein WAT39_11590 [Planctomycetota bacterium]